MADTSDAASFSLGGETVKATLAKLTMAAAGFVGTILFARVLGPTAFGGFYLLLSLVKLADRPLAGWGNASKKRYSEADASASEILGTQLLVNAVGIALAVAVAFALGGLLVSYTGLDAAPLLFVVLFASVSLFEPLHHMINARGLVGVATWIDTLRSYLTLPLQIVFVLAGMGAAGMAFGLTAATLLVVPVQFYYIRTIPGVPTMDTVRNLGTFARYSIPTSYFSTVYDRFDILLLGALLAPGAAAQYEVAAKLTLPAAFVATAAASGLMARVSNLSSRDEPVGRDVTNTLAFASILAIPIFFGALAMPQKIVVTFYGGDYAQAATLLVGIALYRVVRTQSVPLVQAINGIDRPDIHMRISGVALAFNVVLGIVLTLRFGAIGVVIATIAAEVLIYAAIAYVVRSEIDGIGLLPRTLLEQVGAGVVMYAVVVAARDFIPVRSWVDLVLLVGVGAATYSLVLLVVSSQLRFTIASVLRGSRIEQFVPGRILDW